jgi:SAM-dependent methyltransferase
MKHWKQLNDNFFVNYILTVVKEQYTEADYFLYTCKLFNRLVHACGKLVHNNLKILDAGCATGLPDFYLERKGAEIYLLDYSKEVLKNTKKHQLELKSKNVHYLLGDIKNIPFEDNIFGVVWSEGVIEHFKDEDRYKIISEMVRVTKPGGFIILLAPNSFTPHALGIKQIRRLLNKFPFDDWGKERAYTPKQLGKLLTNLGLNDVHIGSCNLTRTILDDFLMSYPFPLHRIKLFNKIRDKLIELEERNGDLKCGFISGAIGVKNDR